MKRPLSAVQAAALRQIVARPNDTRGFRWPTIRALRDAGLVVCEWGTVQERFRCGPTFGFETWTRTRTVLAHVEATAAGRAAIAT